MIDGGPHPMTGQRGGFDTPGAAPWGALPGIDPRETEGVLGRRLGAYLVDLMIIGGLMLLIGFAILILGFITFGVGWWLSAILIPGTVILYSAVTLGGPAQATLGMRMANLRAVDAATGGPVGMLTAAIHALLFYVSAGTFVLLAFDVLVGLLRPDRRMGRDLLVGLVVIRRF